MPPPPFPSRIEPIKCPAFAISWLGPTCYNDASTLAYGGGGGSARTGISNSITVVSLPPSSSPPLPPPPKTLDVLPPPLISPSNSHKIDTGDQICVGMDMLHYGPKVEDIRLLAAIGMEIRLYSATTGTLLACTRVDNDGANVVALRPGGEACVVGCENGRVLLYHIRKAPSSNSTETETETETETTEKNLPFQFQPVATADGHFQSTSIKKGVCSITYSPHPHLILSSARDGTARVWDAHNGAPLATLTCSITDPQAPPPPPSKPKPKRPSPILVRGCAFGPTDQRIYTCQSGRKGRAYCSLWKLAPSNASSDGPPVYTEVERRCVSPTPVSSMSMSGDQSTVTFGNVEGSIFVYTAENLMLRTRFEDIHDLPVTCMAAQPLGQKDGIFGAISASADNKLAFLSERTLPRSYRRWMFWIMVWIIMGVLGKKMYEECQEEIGQWDMGGLQVCVQHSIFAPPTRPGISFVPH